MLPWAHAAFGYLLYSAARNGAQMRPAGPPTLALTVAAVLPDLIDKPLSWHLELLATGRSLGHSVFTAVLLGIVAILIAKRYGDPQVGYAFGLGYGSHIIGDALWPVANGNVRGLAGFLWPLFAPDRVEHHKGILEHLLALELTGAFLIGTVITVVGGVVWWRDGRPGLSELRLMVGRIRSPT